MSLDYIDLHGNSEVARYFGFTFNALIEFTASKLASTVKYLYAKLEDSLAKVEAIGIQGRGQSARMTFSYHSAWAAGCIATSSNLPLRQIAA